MQTVHSAYPDPGKGLLMFGELGGVWLSLALSSIPPLVEDGGTPCGGDPDVPPD